MCCTAVQQDLGMGAMDFVQAFTLPTLRNDEVYYCYPPKGFCLLCQARNIPFKEGQVLMLLAALYGLKNASNYWNTLLTRYLVGPVGLKQCVNDPCLFVCHKRRLYVGVHTDDCLIVGPDDVRDKLYEQVSSKFPVKRLGFPKLWCGLQMERVGLSEF